MFHESGGVGAVPARIVADASCYQKNFGAGQKLKNLKKENDRNIPNERNTPKAIEI